MAAIAKQAEQFYKFVGEILKIHHSNPDSDADNSEEHLEKLRNQLFSANPETDIMIEEMAPFLNKFLLRMMKDKGVKRKNNKSVINMFYDKKLKGYNKNDLVTQLSRHLVIDPTNLSIVSLGILKSTDYQEFKKKYSFGEIQLEEFLDGTMCVYTPQLASYQENIIDKNDENDVAETETQNETDNDNEINQPLTNETNQSNTNIQDRRLPNYKFSTRRVLGTGYYNNNKKSFADMFKENNENSGLNLDELPEKYKKNHSFVFTVVHPDNRIITPVENGRNVLCAIYEFKPQELVNQQWREVLSSLGTNEFNDKLEIYYTDMVKEVNLEKFRDEMLELGLQFNIRTIISKDAFKSYEEFENYVINLHEYDQGIIVRAPNGERSKFRNPKYTELKELKGNLPIFTEEGNERNLFALFWRLRQRQDKSITRFCNHFGKSKYLTLFNYFNNLIYNLTETLHATYMAAFVKKTMAKPDIQFELKPLCGDLHKLYNERANDDGIKKGITKLDTITYVNQMPLNKISWRIFGDHTNKNF